MARRQGARVWLLGVGLLGVWLLLTSAAAQQSATTQQLEQEIQAFERLLQQRQLEQNSIDSALADTRSELEERLAERDRLAEDISALRRERRELQEDITAREADIEENRARMVELEADLQVLELRLQSLMVNLHKQRANRYAQALSQARSFFDLRVRNHYLSLLAEQDVELLTQLERTISALAEVQQTLTEQVAALDVRQSDLLANESQLSARRDALDQVVASLEASQEGQLAQRQSVLREQDQLEASIRDSRQTLQSEVARLRREAEEARRRAEAAAAAERERLAAVAREQQQRANALEATQAREFQVVTVPAPAPQPNTAFLIPFPNAQLISRYGEEGPYISLRAGQEGSAVRAALGGTVQAISRISANSGYLLAIYHSPELMTAYLNLQEPTLSVGDRVNQGQIVGYLGGGALTRADTLKFFVGVPQSGGSAAWIDPAPRLGLR